MGSGKDVSMTRSDPLFSICAPGRFARAYGVAIVSVTAAALARLAVDPIAHEKGPFVLFVFAVVAASLFGGFRGGFTAVLLSLVAIDYLFIEPRYTFFSHDPPGDTVLLLLFSALGIALSWLIERLNRATARLHHSEAELITARALLEARQSEVQRANERFEMAAKPANEAIWELNVKAQNVWCSDVYIKSFGYTGGDHPSESWLDHVHPEDRQRVQTSFANAVTGGDGNWVCEYRLRRADGTWANIENRAAISRDPAGTAVRVVGAILDVTESRQAQEELDRRTDELVRSNEQLRRFAFAVSHDLQAPLRMISEYCRRLIQAESPENRQTYVQAIQDGVGRMRALIQDMLEFAQVSTQSPAPEARTDSGVILQLALQHLQFRIEETGARITIDPLPVVMVNDSRLLRVFQNLIGNALKYCERTPDIRISAVLHGELWTFSIADNGIGIAAEDCDRVFGAFERLHGRERYQGTGLGLALVKRIIESYGGRIWLESELGAGSTFHFSLPAAQNAASAKRAS